MLSNQMLLIDAFFRFSGVGLLLLIAAINLRDTRMWRGNPYLILSCLSLIGLFLGYTPDSFKLPDGLYHAVRILDVPHLVFVWLFSLSLYCKDFQLTPLHCIVGLLYSALIVWVRLSGFGIYPPVPNWLITLISLASLFLVMHLTYATLRERQDDLMTARRTSRLYFIFVIVFVAIIAAISEPIFIKNGWMESPTFKILSIWPAIVIGALWLLKADKDAISLPNPTRTEDEISGRDSELKQKLDNVMLTEEMFRSSDLTITKLAAHLGVTQHRLRELINEVLGYKNFSSYMNAFRIAAAKKSLSDPRQRHMPIQNIAMDCGFKSMSPFNRAFRLSEGATPSEYRMSQMDKVSL